MKLLIALGFAAVPFLGFMLLASRRSQRSSRAVFRAAIERRAEMEAEQSAAVEVLERAETKLSDQQSALSKQLG
jgi:hypothetical protein